MAFFSWNDDVQFINFTKSEIIHHKSTKTSHAKCMNDKYPD